MASRKELETLNSTLLAVLCEKVAAVSDAPTAATARALRDEWAALQSPPSTNQKEERVKDEQRLLSGHPKTGQWWSGQNRPT